MNENDRASGDAGVHAPTTPRPDCIPDTAECVEGVWIYQWTSDSYVQFEQVDGVEGVIDGNGLTLDVEDGERGRDWAGDCAHNRTLPMAALRRALEMYDESNGGAA